MRSEQLYGAFKGIIHNPNKVDAIYEAARKKTPMPILGRIETAAHGEAIAVATQFFRLGYNTQIMDAGNGFCVTYHRHGF